MSREKDKPHWYDGWIYANIISEFQEPVYKAVKKLISEDSTVLDVACATGGLSFVLKDKAKKVIGIDISIRNIKTAQDLLQNDGAENLKFIHGDASELSSFVNNRFDYAVISFAIHEMPSELRKAVLSQMKDVADKIIIADYMIPQSKGFWGRIVTVVEFFAGKDHFRQFRDFRAKGGIKYILKEAKLEPEMVLVDDRKISAIVLAS